MEALSLRSVTHRFGETTALKDVTLTVEGPQLLAILGPNGAGKSTLLDIASGLFSPSEGEVRVLGATLANYPRRSVGVVLQREAFLDGMTVRDYAELFAAIHRIQGGGAAVLQRAGLCGRGKVSARKLSGGEAQRLVIAAATVHDPPLLLLDEPTSALDPVGKAAVGELLRVHAKERTVVLATHDLGEAAAVSDRIVFLREGKIAKVGTLAELLESAGATDLGGAFRHFTGSPIRESGTLA